MDAEKIYTYEDYYKLDDGLRYEVYYGKIYAMSPAPIAKHQRLQSIINTIFESYLKGKKCKVFPTPFDVRFIDYNENGKNIDCVLQPDLSIVCDKSKIDRRGCIGAPDLVVEILSKGTSQRDTQTKFDIYEKYGVKEYWIVYPNDEIISVYKLNKDAEYGKPKIYTYEDKIKVGIFPDLELDLRDVFERDEEEI